MNAFDADHQRVFKLFTAVHSGATLGWFMSYDPLGRLTEVQYFPRVNIPGTYQLFQLIWIGDRLVGYWQTDMPDGTTSKRYVGSDETGRPIDMLSWPSSGDAARDWSINPSAWGEMEKAGHFQPILFAGQYLDDETLAQQSDGITTHRPGLVVNGYRTYDPLTGSYLQVDPLVPETWSSYGYVDSNPVGRVDRDGRAWDGSSWDGEGETIVIEGEAPDGPTWVPVPYGGLYPTWCFTYECLGLPGPNGGGGGGDWGPTRPPPAKPPKKPEVEVIDDEADCKACVAGCQAISDVMWKLCAYYKGLDLGLSKPTGVIDTNGCNVPSRDALKNCNQDCVGKYKQCKAGKPLPNLTL